MTMTNVTLQVTEEMAERLYKEGTAEVVFRQSRSRFEAFLKGKVLRDGLNNNDAAKALEALDKVLTSGNKPKDVNAILHAAGSLLESNSNSLSAIGDGLKNMSSQVDGIFNGLNSIQSLSFLNSGLSAANLAVNVASMIIICHKLDSLRGEVSSLSKKLVDMKEGDIEEQYLKFAHYFDSVTRKINDKDDIDLDELDQMLSGIDAYLHKLLHYYQKNVLDAEELLNLMASILPMYTALLNIFVINYFFDKQKLPSDFDSFTAIYNELASSSFGQLVFDYCFLDKKMCGADARDAANATVMLTVNNYVQIVDQVTILKELKTKENYEQYDAALNNYASQQTEKLLEQIK